MIDEQLADSRGRSLRQTKGDIMRGTRYPYLKRTILLLSLFFPHSSMAALDEAMQQAGWQEITFKDKKPNQFSLSLDTAENSHASQAGHLSHQMITLKSSRSVSVAYYPFEAHQTDLRKTPYLSFSWQASGDKINSDIGVKGGDDRMLSVYLAFAYQPEHAGFSERLSRPFVEGVHGRDAPGRLISYVWAAKPDTDDWIENPYTGKAGYMKILSDADSPHQQWISHKVNLLDDFVSLYGFTPDQLLYIAISADTDDTQTSITAQVTGITFSED